MKERVIDYGGVRDGDLVFEQRAWDQASNVRHYRDWVSFECAAGIVRKLRYNFIIVAR